MKFRNLTATVSAVALSFGLAAGAHAQTNNEFTIEQAGSGNVADLNQVGYNNGQLGQVDVGNNRLTQPISDPDDGDVPLSANPDISDLVSATANDLDRTIEDQNGDSGLNIDIGQFETAFQAGTPGTQGSLIRQRGDDNLARINSVGNTNFASVVQDSDDTLGGDRTTAESEGSGDLFTQNGNNNILLADQTDTDTNSAAGAGIIRGEQLGNQNITVAKQAGASELTALQVGSYNSIQMFQANGGNDADINQTGNNNRARGVQSSTFNSVVQN
jgi:hypothetical protein